MVLPIQKVFQDVKPSILPQGVCPGLQHITYKELRHFTPKCENTASILLIGMEC